MMMKQWGEGRAPNMAKLSQGSLSAVAVSLGASVLFGAAQFASGRDLSGLPNDVRAPRLAASVSETIAGSGVNRATKADRGLVVADSSGPTRTISVRLNSSPDMSVAIRIPLIKEARNNPVPLLMNSSQRKVACEPVVSVLTEVAKQLQPGRCVT
jgi:hypothetical protein